MFGLGKKKEEEKKKEPDVEPLSDGSDQNPAETQQADMASTGNVSIDKIAADVMKLKIQFESFGEVRAATNERFTRISEQIGELRSMIIERDKAFQHVEAQAIKATDLVEAVQPDKLMVDVKKLDGKIEALKANIESNEAIMNNIMNEMKEMRNKMTLFKGAEQVTKMNDDMMKEINDMRKLKAIIEKHSDKVETIFMEVQKNFSDFNKIKGIVDEVQKSVKPVGTEIDALKVKAAESASKKEVSDLLGKFQEFEKHMSKVVELLDKRTESAPKEMNMKFEAIEREYTAKINEEFKKAQKAKEVFEQLKNDSPDVFKKFKVDKIVEKTQVGAADTKNPDVEEKKKDEKEELSKEAIFKTDEKKRGDGPANPESTSQPQQQPAQPVQSAAQTQTTPPAQ